MDKRFIFLLLLFSNLQVLSYGQCDEGTKFLYNDKWEVVKRERKADFYRIVGPQVNGCFYYKDYYITGELQNQGQMCNSDCSCAYSQYYCKQDGINFYYDKNGKVNQTLFFDKGIAWEGYRQFTYGGTYYEATFKNGVMTQVHKKEAVKDNSFSDNVKTAVIGGAIIYGLYKLFSGGGSSSSSSSSSDNSSYEKSHTWTCNSNGTMITIRQSGSTYYIGDESFYSWDSATKRACIKTKCTNCN